MVPTKSPKKAYRKGGSITLYIRWDTTNMIMDPPMIFPNNRKEIDTIFASSPIRFSGIMKNIG
jgi:hypothetical protein